MVFVRRAFSLDGEYDDELGPRHTAWEDTTVIVFPLPRHPFAPERE